MKIAPRSPVQAPMRLAPLFALALATPTVAVAAPRTGAVKGVVTWKGAAPTPTPVDRSSDPVCAASARSAEDVVVTDGKLRDVLVRVKLPPASTPPTPPSTPALIGQSECMYAPRVVGIVAGQKVEVRNLDATFHNVRGNLATKVLWNLGQAKGAPAIVRDNLGAAGDVVSLHCDVHPWMAAWVVVHDHPHFTVTGADGAFTLPDLPPGTYTLEAWHPTLGTRTTKVKVKGGKTARATVTFAAK